MSAPKPLRAVAQVLHRFATAVAGLLRTLSPPLTYRFVAGFARHVHLKLTGKQVLVTGTCRMCGACCRHINIEHKGRWLHDPRQFTRLKQREPDYNRFQCLGTDSSGFLVFDCTWQRPDGTCRDHGNRLAMCRGYPSKGLYFIGGTTLDGCGYRLGAGVPFNDILNEKLRRQNRR